MQENVWFRPLVWTDYRLAVLFTVVIPLALLIWALVKNSTAVQRLLMIYWRVASLLAITVYLMIGSWPIAFVTALMARILIPISLWFWQDLNEEINDLPQKELKLALTSWRWAITVYSVLGIIIQLPFQRCAFAQDAIKEPFCSVWLDPPLLFKNFFHPKLTVPFLGGIGIFFLIIYLAYFGHFLFFRMGKNWRSALEQ